MEDFLKKAWELAVKTKNAIFSTEGQVINTVAEFDKKIYDNTFGKVVTPILKAEDAHIITPILNFDKKIYENTVAPILKKESELISSFEVPFAEGFKKGKNDKGLK